MWCCMVDSASWLVRDLYGKVGELALHLNTGLGGIIGTTPFFLLVRKRRGTKILRS